jgi:hypothetical protein
MPVHGYLVGDDGAIWLRREDDGGRLTRWVLFDAQLKARGRVDIPRNVYIRWTSGNQAWGDARDADDVPWVVRYRIE